MYNFKNLYISTLRLKKEMCLHFVHNTYNDKSWCTWCRLKFTFNYISFSVRIYVLRYECSELYNLCTVDEVQMEKPIMSSLHKTI